MERVRVTPKKTDRLQGEGYRGSNDCITFTLNFSPTSRKMRWVYYHTLSLKAPPHLPFPHSYFTVPDTRELPSIPESRNLTEYFVAVDVNNMLHLYVSMLYERRILIRCSKLSTLTAYVHGSAAMMYPMYWQHVYIPVLPQHLIDYCW
ncbi:unnamed protein product [Oncorhynchus mykiss]|uniref:UDENN domain-containing protein n=1 Tax=Oncorhynchus mykiss TaxID=8022 RepID=A0A060XKM7_ONCMY|nr:unnamed protein product [Oncorhynchus mykiss]